MIRIDIATLFVDMCETVLNESIIGRARKSGMLNIHCHNIRDFTNDKHRRVDDTCYGGGMGMLMQAEPIYNCYKAVCEEIGTKPHVIYMSPQAYPLTQQKVLEIKNSYDYIFIICGHYEGVDYRIIDEIVDEEISIGDYVLTGGELGALVLVDAVGRLCDGVLSNETCFTEESHFSGMLEYPQYTKPSEWNERKVPDVLLSGHHANINKWRHEQSILQTYKKRPDLIQKANLSKKELEIINHFNK